MSAKGYVDFDSFKASRPQRKPKLPICPKCKKPMEYVMTNAFGKRMCADCLWEEEQKRDAARAKREAKMKVEIDEETETFDI